MSATDDPLLTKADLIATKGVFEALKRDLTRIIWVAMTVQTVVAILIVWLSGVLS